MRTMSNLAKGIAAVSLVLFAAAAVSAPRPQAAQSQPAAQADVEAIRLARKDLNDALASRNLELYASYWTRDATVVWAGGEIRTGIDDNAKRLAGTFADPHFSGMRNIKEIEVAKGSLSAAEFGDWVWSFGLKDGSVASYRGQYLVMWHKNAGQWRIQSELYVWTSCTGDTGC
jgi:ketosteroid isomerase-like protein